MESEEKDLKKETKNVEKEKKDEVQNNTEIQEVNETKSEPEVKIEKEDSTDSKDNSEYEELNDRYKRLLAEFENYKKRSQKEKESIYGMITGDVVATMLPIMDNLEKAAEAKTDDTQYQDGVKLVARQFQDALKKLGLEEIETLGKRFDPEFHEAVSHIEDETRGEQEIVQEYRKGYKIGNKVVRHSMVIVAN